MAVCSWPAASVSHADLLAILHEADRHRPGARIVSCQRVEVVHRTDCGCGAPRRWSGFDALFRIAEVAAGLDSLVLGEDQVLGQVRTALANGGGEFDAVGAIAVAAARELRAETEFRAHTGHLLDRALHVVGTTARGRIAVVGAGAVGHLVAERARELGFGEIIIVARRRPEAAWFDPAHLGYAPYDGLRDVPAVDVLVSALGSGAAPLRADELPPITHLAVDLGTPRNLEDGLAVPLVTIAGLLGGEAPREHGEARRAALRGRLRTILERRLDLATRTSATGVGALRREVERIRLRELSRATRLHPDIPLATLDGLTRALVNQIFHEPTRRLARSGDEAFSRRLVALFAEEASE